jgi:hypothetical protein
VTNGDSTAWTLGRTTLGGRVLAWHDVLHEGPVPAADRATVRSVRAGFLSACGWGSASRLRELFASRDDDLATALRARRRVGLWFEHDLYDQLQLLDALALAHETGFESERFELIVVGAFPGKPGFRGLGELTAEELETLWPARTAVTPTLARLAHEAWAAIRTADPHALAATASVGVDGLPYLAPALRRLLEELPEARTGLSRTERQILETLAAEPSTPAALFLATQALEEAPFLGDAWFYRSLAALGTGEPRLVETVQGEPVPAPPPLGDARVFAECELRMTDRGSAVLRAEADRVALVPLDRWLLGTHLTAPAPWRWDAAGRRLLRG